LYIFGGHRNSKDSCNDFMVYDAATTDVTNIQTYDATDEPLLFFGQSYATINEARKEIYVLQSDKLWMFALETKEWSLIYKHPTKSFDVLYFGFNPVSKSFVCMFKSEIAEISLWSLCLERPSRSAVSNYCKYLIRKQHYEEITYKSPVEALRYLQNKLSETIDQDDEEQLSEFHKLAALIFSNQSSGQSSATDNDIKLRNQRSNLFSKLIELLPSNKCQPRQTLSTFISI